VDSVLSSCVCLHQLKWLKIVLKHWLITELVHLRFNKNPFYSKGSDYLTVTLLAISPSPSASGSCPQTLSLKMMRQVLCHCAPITGLVNKLYFTLMLFSWSLELFAILMQLCNIFLFYGKKCPTSLVWLGWKKCKDQLNVL